MKWSGDEEYFSSEDADLMPEPNAIHHDSKLSLPVLD